GAPHCRGEGLQVASRGGGMGTADGHRPVMTERVLALLAPALESPGSILVDATLGRAGHASALLAEHPGLTVIGVDADDAAIAESSRLLAPYRERGILFDLGVSSPQLDDPARGFAYSRDAPLDMRMDRTRALTAAEVVNTYPAARLAKLLREYGEERFARRIADAVVRERSRAPLTSTTRLSEIVRDSIPAPARRTGGNPAKRTFQALRIEVNGELDTLHRALPMALDALAVGGRIVVLAYHSLEDRASKGAVAGRAVDTTPRGLPVPLPASSPQFRLLTRGAERPSARELAANP